MKKKKLFTTLSDLFFICRPILLIPVWGFTAFGYFKASDTKITLWEWDIPLRVYIFSTLFSFSVASVYIFNQLADIEVDKKNGGLPLIASGIVSKITALFFALILAILSIVVPFFFSEPVLSFLAFFSITTGLFYSFKPLFLSGKPFLDFLTNAFGYGILAFGTGWFLAGRNLFSIEFFVSASPYFFLMSAGSISSTLPDINGDKAEGKKTTAVVLGHIRAHSIATFFLCIAGLFAFLNKDPVTIFCSFMSLPFYLIFYIKRNSLVIESTYKIGGALCMTCAGILFPAILVAGILVFIITWLYFRIRHGVSYPSLIPYEHEN